MSMIKEAIEHVAREARNAQSVKMHPQIASHLRSDLIYYEMGGLLHKLELPMPHRVTHCTSIADLAIVGKTMAERGQLKEPIITCGLERVTLYPNREDYQSYVYFAPTYSTAYGIVRHFVRYDPFGNPRTVDPRTLFDLLDQHFTEDDYPKLADLIEYVQSMSNKTAAEAGEEHSRSAASTRASMAQEVKGGNPDFDGEHMMFNVRTWMDDELDGRHELLLTVRPSMGPKLGWMVWADQEAFTVHWQRQLNYLRSVVASHKEHFKDIPIVVGQMSFGTDC